MTTRKAALPLGLLRNADPLPAVPDRQSAVSLVAVLREVLLHLDARSFASAVNPSGLVKRRGRMLRLRCCTFGVAQRLRKNSRAVAAYSSSNRAFSQQRNPVS